MMNRLYIFLLSLLIPVFESTACTNLIVGKKASVDGSVIVSYSSDDYGAYGYLFFQKGGKHVKGEMRALYHYESNNFLGEIPEADSTYQVVGLTNEHQLTIFETTWGGRAELEDTTGLFDYGSLMQVTLQRARTARQAIDVMVDLVNKYGYQSEGESFTIADKDEVWIMDMIGKGKVGGAPVWVARRIPDDCISGHANQCRIHKFPQSKKLDKQHGYYIAGDDCLYSKEAISFAKSQGYFKGNDIDFDFANAYNPLDFGGARFCEARIWSFFNKWADIDMNKYLSYASGDDLAADPFPLYVKPKQKLSVQDVKEMMRDHYEGTPFDNLHDLGMGPYEMPYRPTPLTWEVDNQTYFNERPISTQQSSCVYVAQMRNFLPDHIGALLWFGNDDANMVALTPIYCSVNYIPGCFAEKSGDTFTFSFESAYWMQNWVSNMVYYRYKDLFPELQKVREELEDRYYSSQKEVEATASSMSERDAKGYLTNYSSRQSYIMMNKWMHLAQYLIVKYNDMAMKSTNDDGSWRKTKGGVQMPVVRNGYPENFRRAIVKETGNKLRNK